MGTDWHLVLNIVLTVFAAGSVWIGMERRFMTKIEEIRREYVRKDEFSLHITAMENMMREIRENVRSNHQNITSRLDIVITALANRGLTVPDSRI